MTSFDYDVVIIGSGFGGSVAALRAAEKGYRVGVMEAGRRWKDEDIPKTNWNLTNYLWQPEAEMYGMQRIEPLDDVLVLSGAGVGGGSHVYGNTLYIPPKKFFDAPGWAGITDWADELAPCIDQARRMLGVVRYPYMPTDIDRYMQQVAIEMGRGESFNKAPVGVYFGSPGVEADDPYFGGVGPRRTGCIGCGNCQVGCGHNAKNKLTTNYLYLAEKLGAEIHELHEVYDLVPLDGGGFEVHARHPGWAQRAAHLHRQVYTAEQVIVAAHAYGSSKLLLHMQHKGRLTGLSSELGQRARTNSEQLLVMTRPHDQWKRDPEEIHIQPGSVAITSGVWPDAVTSIEPVYYGVGSSLMALLFTYHQRGDQKRPATSWLKELFEHPAQVLGIADPRHWSERAAIMLCMQTTDTSIELYWQDGLLRSRHSAGTRPPVHIPIAEEFADRLAEKMGSREGALVTEVINRNASAHFIGGIPIGDSCKSGAVDPYQRLFGQPGLHVIDGSVMPANPGVNPSLMITALAERAMSLWPKKGDADTRPPLGSGYQRVDPVMPRRPVVPAGAPAELRLDAKKSDIIPEYPDLIMPDDKETPMNTLATDTFRTIGPKDAIPNNFVVPYYLGDRKQRIAVARVDDRLYAFDDLCTCADEACSLSGGLLTGMTIMCQCHGSRFDITTGAVINGPATNALNLYEVQEIEGSIRIRARVTSTLSIGRSSSRHFIVPEKPQK